MPWNQFIPEVLGADQVEYGTSGVIVPCLQPGTRVGQFGPCVVTVGIHQALHDGWLKLPVPDHMLYGTTAALPSKLVVVSKGFGDPTTSTFHLPKYRIEIIRPYIFVPTTSPNSGNGSFTLNADAVEYSCSAAGSTTDAHASNGSDWTSVLATEIAITAPSGGDLASAFNRGQAMLHVYLPYMAPSPDNNIAFAIFGVGWSKN